MLYIFLLGKDIIAYFCLSVNRFEQKSAGSNRKSAERQAEKGYYMAKENCTRSGCKDVFRAFLVKNATYDTPLEIPDIKPENRIPQKLIPFSKAIGGKDYNCFIHFYEDDANFERLWNNPQKYLAILKKYNGVITPDFSIYRDMPLVMQQWNTYRNRAIGCWLQENNIPTITNVRWGDARTFSFCCAGAPKNSIIAIGSHGCIKLLQERPYFIDGLAYSVKTLKPKTILVYGTAPDYIFSQYRKKGIKILQFDSTFMQTHRKVGDA